MGHYKNHTRKTVASFFCYFHFRFWNEDKIEEHCKPKGCEKWKAPELREKERETKGGES